MYATLYAITGWIITTQFLTALFVFCILNHYLKPRYKRRDTKPIKTKILEPEKIILVKADNNEHIGKNTNTRQSLRNNNNNNNNESSSTSRPTSSTPLYNHSETESIENIAVGQTDDNGAELKILENPFEMASEPTYKLVPDLNYYFQQYGLTIDSYRLSTEDGFIIDIWHIVNPNATNTRDSDSRPVLFLHGLLQSSGSFASSGTKSLAYYLTVHGGKDCWLGNNRCGFVPGWEDLTINSMGEPENKKKTKKERWAWDILDMAKYDLPCLVDFVLKETNSKNLDLIAHSQGTMQSFYSLTNHRELLGKIKNFVALSPAVYPGALLYEKIPLRLMALLIDNKWIFGKTVFIPLMMQMRKLMGSQSSYCKLAYLMFNYLFDWGDSLWDRHLRDRHFLFSPVYISVRLMQWWLSSKRPSFRNGEFDKTYFPEHKVWYPTDFHNAEQESRNSSSTATFQKTATRAKSTHIHNNSDKNLYPNFLIFAPRLDRLVDGARLINHFTKYEDPALYKIWYIEHYSHLDVLWADDVLEKIGKPILDHL